MRQNSISVEGNFLAGPIFSHFYHQNFAFVTMQDNTIMSVDVITTLVKVVDVQEKFYSAGKYKEVGVKTETGFWSKGFLVNMFPNHDNFNDVEIGVKLCMQVGSSLHTLFIFFYCYITIF